MADQPASTTDNSQQQSTEQDNWAPTDHGDLSEPQQAAAEPQAPETLDPEYVSRAGVFNLTEEDLRSTPRPLIEKVLAAADHAMIEAFRREPRQPQAPAGPPAAPSAAPPATELTFKPYELAFDPEAEVAEPIVKNLDGFNRHVAQQFDQLHRHYQQKFQQLEQAAGLLQRHQDYAILDRFIEGLGPDWTGVFGKGSRLELDPRSQEFLKSEELRTAAIEAMQLHARLTGRGLPVRQALSRALHSMFWEKASAIERAQADAKRKELAAGAAVRPKASQAQQPNVGIRGRAAHLAKMAAH